MAPTIEELLHRRTDLSTFLTHFTKDGENSSAKENLVRMLRSGYVEARNPFGMGRNVALYRPEFEEDSRFQDSQKVVCLSETPLEHAWMMCSEIEGREKGFAPYGLAFTKTWARLHNVNPVWYLDMTPGHDWLTVPFDSLRDSAIEEAIQTGRSLAEFPVTRLLPFIEQMGPTSNGRKEWWWEREWRRIGHLNFSWTDVVAVFAPCDEHDEILQKMRVDVSPDYPQPPLLDPNWGLERMISALRGIPPQRAGPFPR